MRPRSIAVAATCAAALVLGVFSASASAEAPVHQFDVELTSQNAGAHPDLLTEFTLGNIFTEPPLECGDCNAAKEVAVNTPPGLVGLPRALPRCTQTEFALGKCPVGSQIGQACLKIRNPEAGCTILPVYNMIPQAGQAALAAFPVPLDAPGIETPVYISFTVRTESDYGLETKSFGIPRRFGSYPLALRRLGLIFWGVPSDPKHDPVRVPHGGYELVPGAPNSPRLPYYSCHEADPVPKLLAGEYPYPTCPNLNATSVPEPVPSNAPKVAFLQNPTTCVGPQTATIDTLAYDSETDHGETEFPEIVGCDKLPFDPSLSAAPTTTQADAPSGLDVDLTVRQNSSAETPASSQIRSNTVTLPPGFTLNPNAANGKVACTAAQARFGTRLAAQCPDNSKIGNLQIETTALPAALPGSLYLGEPLPGDRYRTILVADDFGLHLKLPGTADPDPNGLSFTFNNLPQNPIQRLDLHVFGAERGILATPTRCGTYPVVTEFVPWAFPEVPKQTSTQFFRIDSGPNGASCPGDLRPFSPDFSAGVLDNTAAARSPFLVRFGRDDGEQFLASTDVKAPEGFSAILQGIPYCSESAIAMIENPLYPGIPELSIGACPAASQIGTAVGIAGAGSRPVSQGGRIYMSGPYKGAPLSLVVVIPAVTGPYDLGNLVTRVALFVDPVTARVTAVSDPLPRSIDDIPLRIREVQVNIDRNGFAVNPTNCSPTSVEASITGDEGAMVNLTRHFQVANCGILPFEPKLRLRLSRAVNRRGHPAIHAVYRAQAGEANARVVSVTLPKGQLLDNEHIDTICTRVQFAAKTCPAGSLIGVAEARTPILDQPLRGRIYLRSSSNQLPDLALDLQGQVDFEVVGRIDSVKGRLRTTFESLPDVPVSEFVLDLKGGKKGLLINSEDQCGKRKSATVKMTGQNGATHEPRVRVEVACGKAPRDKRKKDKRKNRRRVSLHEEVR